MQEGTITHRPLTPYTEPVIFYEYMHDSAALGRKHGVGAVMISNGYIQEKAVYVSYARYVTGVKIDLKAFTEAFLQRAVQWRAENRFLATLELLREIGIWFRNCGFSSYLRSTTLRKRSAK